MLILIRVFRNTYESLKICNTILEFCIIVLIDKFILPQLAHTNKNLATTLLTMKKVKIWCKFPLPNLLRFSLLTRTAELWQKSVSLDTAIHFMNISHYLTFLKNVLPTQFWTSRYAYDALWPGPFFN